MSYQTLVVLALSAMFSFLVLSLLAAGVSAFRRDREGGGPARRRAAGRNGATSDGRAASSDRRDLEPPAGR